MAVFTGAIPRECIWQLLETTDIARAKRVHVCCSGSFRLERALAGLDCELHGNDISLLSCAIGQYAAGEPLAWSFRGELEPLEGLSRDPVDRLAALVVAAEAAAFLGKNPYATAHRTHILANATTYIDSVRPRLVKFLGKLRLSSFFAGDFRKHAECADYIAAWPPTYKGGYERLYRFIDKNTEWTRPSYDVFDPEHLGGWLELLDGRRVPYCVCSDQLLDGREPVTSFQQGRQKPVFIYASEHRRASVRSKHNSGKAWRFQVVDPWALSGKSSVSVVALDKPYMDYIRTRFLAAGLVHVDGSPRYAVFVNGRLAGGIVYARVDVLRNCVGLDGMKVSNTVYLLSDFSVAGSRRLAKLIAMIATSRELVRRVELDYVQGIRFVSTTVFTHRKASMKYRGVFEKVSAKDDQLGYASPVREASLKEVYREWWRRYAANAGREAEAV